MAPSFKVIVGELFRRRGLRGLRGLRRLQARLQFAAAKPSLNLDVLSQFFLGGTGIARMRCHFMPRPLRKWRTWLGPRRSPVNR